tara:strand:- start:1322 stop:1960 length:639 start_codon:yes stop_codon:yes gene_type:complete
MTLNEWLKNKPPWIKGAFYTFLTAITIYLLFSILEDIFPAVGVLLFPVILLVDIFINNFGSIDPTCDVSWFSTCSFGTIDRLIFLLIIILIGGIIGFFVGRNKEKIGMGMKTKEDSFLKIMKVMWIILAILFLISLILSSFGSFNEGQAEKYYNLAFENEDPSMCEKINTNKGHYGKDRCYYWLSYDTQDSSLCEKIKENGYKVMCANLYAD